jgi:hypothetical protein
MLRPFSSSPEAGVRTAAYELNTTHSVINSWIEFVWLSNGTSSGGLFEYGNAASGFTEGGDFLYQVIDYQHSPCPAKYFVKYSR